jgi:hypothetical protein
MDRGAGRHAVARTRPAASHHNDVEFEREGVTFTVRVPDELRLKVELEIEDDGIALEIELTG